MNETNNDPLNKWRDTARYWARHDKTIRQMFTPLTEALIETAAIKPGQHVLDVAGGSGEPSLTIAEVVGPGGSVMCTDAVLEMVQAAESNARERNLTNVQFRQCTPDSLPFQDNVFDATVCRLGAMFFPDPLVALREMLRVTKPGGRVAFVVWSYNEMNPFTQIPTEVMARHVESPPPSPGDYNAFRFAEPGELSGILTAAGATDVSEQILSFTLTAPITLAEFWTLRSETSESLRTKLKQLSEETRSQIETEVKDQMKQYFPNNQMAIPSQMLLISGTKPVG